MGTQIQKDFYIVPIDELVLMNEYGNGIGAMSVYGKRWKLHEIVFVGELY